MIDNTLGSHIAHNARRFPNKTALIDFGGRLSYRDLDLRTNRIANALAVRGIGPGDKVALLSKSDIGFVVLLYGILKSGAAAVPLNYRLTAEDIAETVTDSESRLFFVEGAFHAPAGAAAPAIETVLIDGEGAGSLTAFLEGVGEGAPGMAVAPQSTALIMYTGGTTGKSKGVVLSHEKVFWNCLDEIIDTRMHEDDNTILATPLHHAAALNCWLMPHLYLGATGTIVTRYSPEMMLRMIAEHKATNGFTPPSMARDLYSHPLARELDLSSFRRWYVGGATMSRTDRDAMHALIPGVEIYYQYGITEVAGIVSVLKQKDYERAPGSIGRAFLNMEIKILREDMSDAATGEVGEIVVRGRQVTEEYYRRPDATAAAFHQGWFRTGDLGALDEGGFLTFHDRLKDMVKTGGLNVYSQEVEQTLQKHPAIREIAVIGLPSEKWGEEVTGIVVLRDGHDASADDIIAFGRERLAHYKVPKTIRFFDYADMPINYSGKILKRDLRQKLLRG